ncbi:glycoside hydrolase family 43 protein [Chitinophaga niabensis]|uniref:Beta-xylosidase, GH43 family n=1 Tax=Chitinophaga niabensis TaxID=536979 RepID=A0A1N6KE40_9BACT|nr:glycoside hydrolase family 43 protein [Chitinophaga niabensis]SIO54822.1 Beta-xylosidase, GH43 family [Chitinophaga niabensis]
MGKLVFRRSYIVSLMALMLSCSETKKATDYPPPDKVTTFYNPLLGSGPDPWVYKKDGSFYYMHTMVNSIAIWKTRAISELGKAPVKTVWTPPASGNNTKNIWAPELHFLQGKWYLYYTAGATTNLATQRCFVLENPNPDPTTGSWTDKGKLADPLGDYFAIDGTILEYKDKLYFIWSGQISGTDISQRIYIAEMENPWTLKSSRVQLSFPQYDWEKKGSAVNEGPEVLKNPAGNVFVVYSGSNCATDDYGLGMLRLKENGDPLNAADWTKSPVPVFTKSINNNVFGPGHNGFFKSRDDKEDWIIYHANVQSGQGCGGTRSPRIQRFTWKSDGTPDFGEPVDVSQKLTKPSGESE